MLLREKQVALNEPWLNRVFGPRGLRNTLASLGAVQFGQRKNREGAIMPFLTRVFLNPSPAVYT
jgi:hypothetical protein